MVLRLAHLSVPTTTAEKVEEELMRDPARIDRIISKLATTWKQYPDLRLCQLLANEAQAVGWPDRDLFYIEDEVIESALDTA